MSVRISKAARRFLSRIGKAGGSKTGAAKLRGDPDYYKRIRAIGVARQKERKATHSPSPEPLSTPSGCAS